MKLNFQKIITIPEKIQRNITIHDTDNRAVHLRMNGDYEFHSIQNRTSVYVRSSPQAANNDQQLFFFHKDGFWYFTFGSETTFLENMEVKDSSKRVRSDGEIFIELFKSLTGILETNPAQVKNLPFEFFNGESWQSYPRHITIEEK